METTVVVAMVAAIVSTIGGTIGWVIAIRTARREDRANWWSRFTWAVPLLSHEHSEVSTAAVATLTTLIESKLGSDEDRAIVIPAMDALAARFKHEEVDGYRKRSASGRIDPGEGGTR